MPHLRSALGACLFVLVGCAPTEQVLQAQASGIAIPGPWSAPASTRMVAATEYVPVVDPPNVAPLGHCTSTNAFACSCTHPACMSALPGTRELDAFLRARFPYLRAGGLYCCRQNSAVMAVPALSVHAIGRAIDLLVTTTGGDADNSLGDPVANWLVENAQFIGVQRVIWDHTFWNGQHGFGLLSSASLPHTDHVHVELSVAGAARLTPFFTTGASTGTMTCTPSCDGARVIAADCSATDCSANGASCDNGPPPHCGTPPPPEPPEATPVSSYVPPAVQTLGAPSRFTFLTGSRLFDTRTPEGSTRIVRANGSHSGPLSPASGGLFTDWGPSGLPAGASAVWLNLGAVGVTNPGFVVSFPAGHVRSLTSNLNFVPGVAQANAAPVVLGMGNGVDFEVNTDVDVFADLSGAFSPTGAGLDTAGPTRVLDTRSDASPLTAGMVRSVDVAAPAGATGVAATVTVIAGSAAGFLQVFPCDAPAPVTSNLDFAPQSIVANTVISALGSGRLCMFTNVAADVIVDVTGYLSPTGSLSYTALSPQRLLDTRDLSTSFTGRLAARQVLQLPLQSLPGMPVNVGAVVANVTATEPEGPGFVVAFPCGGAVPPTSSLNFAANQTVAALAMASLGGGNLCVFASTRTHLIVDLVGVWTAVPGAPPPDAGSRGDPNDNGDEPPTGTTNPDGSTSTGDDASALDTGYPPGTYPDGAPMTFTYPDGAMRPRSADGSVTATSPPSDCGCRVRGGPSSKGAAGLGAMLGLLAVVRKRRVSKR